MKHEKTFSGDKTWKPDRHSVSKERTKGQKNSAQRKKARRAQRDKEDGEKATEAGMSLLAYRAEQSKKISRGNQEPYVSGSNTGQPEDNPLYPRNDYTL